MPEQDPRTFLTPAQIACLRLVHHGSSKKIAQIRGGSHNTVDNHIKAALLRLGLDDRDTAAALVRKWDARDSQSLASPPTLVVPDVKPAETVVSQEVQAEPTGGSLREVPTRYGDDPAILELLDEAASSGADDVRLSPFQVLARVLALTVATTIVLSAARPIGEGFEALATLILDLRR